MSHSYQNIQLYQNAQRLQVRTARQIAAIAVLMLLGITATSGVQANDAQTDTPIRFATGKISTTLTDTLHPKQNEHWYQFKASRGQYVLINIAPHPKVTEIANVGILHLPDGTQEGTKGGIIYQGCLPTSGKYRLRIARSLMATEGGTAGYVAEVIILPQSVSQALCD